MAGKRRGGIAVVLCSCGGQLFTPTEAERQRSRLEAALPGPGPAAARVLLHANLCSAAEQRALARSLKTAQVDRVVFAGCPPLAREDVRLAVAGKAGLAPSAIYPVAVARASALRGRTAAHRRAVFAAMLREVRRGLSALSRMPAFSVRRLPVEQAAVVIGAGPAGLSAAEALRELGVPCTVVERGPGPGDGERPRGVRLLCNATLLGLEGQVGAFTLRLEAGNTRRALRAGAVVVAAGTPAPAPDQGPLGQPGVVPLEELGEAAASLPRRREGRELAVVLDWRLEEGKASSESAFRLALELQGQPGSRVHLLCRDVRVASLPLEELYDRAREAGVDVVKHDGELAVRRAEGCLELHYTDALLGAPAVLVCDLIGVSRHGLRAAADEKLAALLGLSTDAMGQLQENNLHLAPEATNRPGLFVVGSCRGQTYLPQIRAEARAAALAVHRLLAPGSLPVEDSSPTVDPEKCALCLTCVRACPFQAMVVDEEAKAAKSLPQVCQRCGICAGECPARAIELPAWSDAVLLAQLSPGAPPREARP